MVVCFVRPQSNIVTYPMKPCMRSLVVLVPVVMAIGFIPFGILLSMTVGSGPLSLVAGALYVVLFPLSPIIIGFFLGEEKSGANEPISRALSPDVGEHRKVESLNDAPPHHEAGGWWEPGPPENHGYQ